MRGLKENINYILEYQSSIGYYMPSIVNPPATSGQIVEIEATLGLKFNSELKELFTTLNGIQLDGKTVSGLTGIIPIYDLLGLEEAVDYSFNMDWDEHVDVYGITFELGHKLFPFIHDGAGNCYWVDLNEGTKNYGRVYWTNTFGDKPDYLFNSLTAFFEAIRRGYEQGIFTLDNNGYLGCDYEKWRGICHELDTSIRYWMTYSI